jgi:predicted CoA-binding protein
MSKLTKDFFTDNEVLVVGYPVNVDPTMQYLMKAFMSNGLKVFALNSEAQGDADVKVYKSLTELPKVPKTAYMYADKKDIDPWIGQLKAAGVEKVLFHSKKDVDPGQLEECAKVGLNTAVACPMMILGKGIHKFHAMLAGV